ncbi:MAG TPA: hypothetical protein VH440_08820 [Candidatus Limnocylindrales bacterium]
MIGRLRELFDRGGAARAEADRIRREGIVGRASVIGTSGTGRRRDDRFETELRVEVLLPRRRRFETTIRDWLTAAERKRVGIGQSVPIAADPAQPGHVVLLLDADRVDPRAIAALGPIAGGPGGPRVADVAPPPIDPTLDA